MWCTGLVALQHVGSSRTRDQTHVPCIARRILNHCATREVSQGYFLFMFVSLACQLYSAPNRHSKTSTEEAGSSSDRQVSWQREKRDGRTSWWLLELLLRSGITFIHISMTKASQGQTNVNAKYNPSVGTGLRGRGR